MKDPREQKELQIEEQRYAEEGLIRKLKQGHRKPITRRDFMAHGLVAGGSFMMLPSLLELLGKGNQAVAATGESIPIVVIEIPGGATLTSFVVPQGRNASFQGGLAPGQVDLLPSYDRVGPVTSIGTPDLDLRFGAPLRTADPMYTSMISQAGDAMNGVSMISACGIVRDDTIENPIGLQTLIAKILAVQNNFRLPILGNGFVNSTGGYNAPLLDVRAQDRGLNVQGVNQLAEVLNVGTPLSSATTEAQRRSLLKAIMDLSASQIKRAHGQHFLQTLRDLASSGFSAARDIANANISLDPRVNNSLNSAYRQVFGIDENTAQNASAVIRAAQLKALFEGLSPVVVWQRTGGDYHTSRINGFNSVHTDVGTMLGQIFRTAHLLVRKVIVIVTTDGSSNWQVVSGQGRVPTGDRGEACKMVMARYDNEHVNLVEPQINFPSLNYFNSGQGANRDDLIAPSPRRLALALVANYAHVAGCLDAFYACVPESVFPHAEVRKYLAFKA